MFFTCYSKERIVSNVNVSLTLYFTFSFLARYRGASSATTGAACPVAARTLMSLQGIPTGDACNTTAGRAPKCSILCGSLPNCKLVYNVSCSLEEHCTCSYCSQLLDVDFSLSNFQFYLHVQKIAENVTLVQLPGGVAIGQPLMMKVTLLSPFTTLKFFAVDRDQPFMVQILFNSKEIIATSYLNQTWGPRETSKPHFNFSHGQEVSVLYVVTSKGYDFYIDQVLFKQFDHIVSPTTITKFLIASEYKLATIISFWR
ncbi:hypothetical protein ElyMa_002378200 [Elysia marginata]|uniref:Galectin n=1 Tax=Elysia marginata TaxID=1093978 RepID=A0AAV4GB92_9GAST|nr:hypothetical protein ElyMa_002378200 [Elysia marginata]